MGFAQLKTKGKRELSAKSKGDLANRREKRWLPRKIFIANSQSVVLLKDWHRFFKQNNCPAFMLKQITGLQFAFQLIKSLIKLHNDP